MATSTTMSHCSSRALSLTSLAFGLVATGGLVLAVATDFWLILSEPVPLSPEMLQEVITGGMETPVMTVDTHSGLWRACINYEEDVPKSCFAIEYIGQTYARVEGASTTMSIIRAIRCATPVIMISLFVMICALGCSTAGNHKNDVKTFVGAVLYVLAALNLAVGSSSTSPRSAILVRLKGVAFIDLHVMGFYGSTQPNRMILAPEQKARDRGFPLLLSINPKGSLSCIPP
ncbi:hypothetical protein CAPTEDRAFT_196114 [Capitella teleta]|uniref:Uncharacterized protein n=1 Tax=Capitella teleta TaxID=283909 RepID=R7T5N0_CAPTE|nr:hypothetical protein CAPTEDRAFT_196114 [Capitella teleta]|eukprot:ELT88463.1 hypothetical protein CAPTEDRAFT_196114 [Capitella teleta]